MKLSDIRKFCSENKWVRDTIDFARDIFPSLLGVLLLLLIIEAIFKGSVTSNFDIGYLLISVVILGIVSIFARSRDTDTERKLSARTSMIFIACAVLVTVFFTWYVTREIGWVSYVISALGGLVAGFLILIVRGEDIKVPSRETLDKIGRIVESSYIQLSVIFIILVFIQYLDIRPFNTNLQPFIYILPFLSIPSLVRTRQAGVYRIPGIPLLLVIIFTFICAIRLIPYFTNSIPLGYDSGIYKYIMELYSDSTPVLPESSLPYWIKRMVPQGFPVFVDNLHLVSGLSAVQFIQGFSAFLSATIVFPVFILTRKLFGTRAGLIAAILYAVSSTQLTVFTAVYLKNMMGLILLLFAIYALEKRKYLLLVLMYAGLGMFHRPEFLLLSLILIPYFIKNRDKHLIFSALGTALLILPFWIIRFDANLSMVEGVFGTTGTFFGFDEYQQKALAYLPFAFIGFFYLIARRIWNSIFFYFVINVLIVVFQILFYKRYIIPLDIVLVISAAVGINYSLLNLKDYAKWAGIAVAVMVFVSSGVLTTKAALEVEPLISEQQLDAVVWISENTEDDAYVLASSYDAPWVLGWSDRRVIAPGMFEWNKQNQAEWTEFFTTAAPDVARGFLDEYEGTIYIYYSHSSDSYLGLEKFDNEYFQVVYDAAAVVYKYLPSGE